MLGVVDVPANSHWMPLSAIRENQAIAILPQYSIRLYPKIMAASVSRASAMDFRIGS